MSLGIDPHELARLVQAAETAPSDVHELRTDTGVVVRIERDPEPGIEKRLFAPDHPEWEVMLTRATDMRPARYPVHLPFVANATAVVGRLGEQTIVTWNQVGDLASFRELMAESEQLIGDPAIREARTRVQPLLERARAGDAAARGALQDEVALVRAATSPETREKLREIWERLQTGPNRVSELRRIFEAVTDASERDGWERVSARESDAPLHTASATFRRGGLERGVAMTAGFGPVSTVMLWEHPAKP